MTLPLGWSEAALDELGAWSSGGTPSRAQVDFYVGDIPWFKTGELTDGLLADSEEHISAAAVAASAAKLVPAGTLLIAMYGATIGKTGILSRPATTNQACAAFSPSSEVPGLARFVQLFINGRRDDLRAAGQGGAQPNLSQGFLRQYRVGVPPLNEQRRIVAKLDAVFEQTRAAKARLERLPALLEKLKRSILAAACSGRLTGEVSDDVTVPPTWRWTSLQDLVVPGGIFDGARDHGAGTAAAQNLRTSDYTSSGARVIRLENLAHLAFISEKQTFISHEKFAGLTQAEVREGDILFGSFIDDAIRVCRLPPLGTPALAKADCFCIRPRPDAVLPAYLLFQLACQRTRDAIDDEAHGLTRLRITTKQLRAIRVPVCSMDEQQEIVRKVEVFFALAADIERAISTATDQSAKLEQAALAKAFRGELVPQDPDDEPASALLERIRAARAAEPERPQRGRRARDADGPAAKPGKTSSGNGSAAPHVDLVIAAFQQEPRLSAESIREVTGLDAAAVKQTLEDLVDGGVVRVVGKGRGISYVWTA